MTHLYVPFGNQLSHSLSSLSAADKAVGFALMSKHRLNTGKIMSRLQMAFTN